VVEILDSSPQAPGYNQEVEALSPAEILEEALKLPLSEQERIATTLSYLILGELQALGYDDSGRSVR
jgi:hypothetical protein